MSRARGGDEGVSLVELVVAMGITSLLLICMASVFTADLRGAAAVRDRTTDQAEVRLALDVMSRRLRVAAPVDASSPAFEVMTSSRIRFTASLQDRQVLADPAQRGQDPGLTRVTYAYDGSLDCLTETLAPVTGAGASTTTCLLRGTSSTAQFFTYYSSVDGQATTTAPADVRSVGVDVTSSSSAGAGGSSSSGASTRVSCPNTVPRA